MFPTELREHDVLFTANRLLQDVLDNTPQVPPLNAARAAVETSFMRQREAALQRNGRLRTIQALHRPSK